MNNQIIICLAACLLSIHVSGQVFITSKDARFISKGNVAISLNDMDFVNHGEFTQDRGQIRFNDTRSLTYLEGSKSPQFYKVKLNIKGILRVGIDFTVINTLTFEDGEIDLLNNDLFLPLNESRLIGETSYNRVLSSGHGEIIKYSVNEQLQDQNIGNLGLIFMDFNNTDSLIIRRGHSTLTLPFGESITRYYSVSTFTKPNDKLRLGLEYFDDEVLVHGPEFEEQIWVKNNGEWNSAQTNSQRKTEGKGYVVNGMLEISESIVTVGLYRRLISKSEIPNVFTPNQDGINDTFIIPGIEKLSNAEVQIYNIYGRLLFTSNDYLKNPWDGTFNHQLQPIGTYHFQVIDSSNPLEFIQGEISIIK
ncbi:MAG: gliding motility-associated-like protein [Roseivirga sp.]|jgi:gliding motility-associated-like protein